MTVNETYTYWEMIKQEDSRQCIQAMTVDISLCKQDDCSFPKTILAVWSFKRKRSPDSSLNKHKARLCSHGGMQQWSSTIGRIFSLVVDWLSVRLVLVLALLYDLPVKSIGFVLLFSQSELDVPIFMELPVGFEVHCG